MSKTQDARANAVDDPVVNTFDIGESHKVLAKSWSVRSKRQSQFTMAWKRYCVVQKAVNKFVINQKVN